MWWWCVVVMWSLSVKFDRTWMMWCWCGYFWSNLTEREWWCDDVVTFGQIWPNVNDAVLMWLLSVKFDRTWMMVWWCGVFVDVGSENYIEICFDCWTHCCENGVDFHEYINEIFRGNFPKSVSRAWRKTSSHLWVKNGTIVCAPRGWNVEYRMRGGHVQYGTSSVRCDSYVDTEYTGCTQRSGSVCCDVIVMQICPSAVIILCGCAKFTIKTNHGFSGEMKANVRETGNVDVTIWDSFSGFLQCCFWFEASDVSDVVFSFLWTLCRLSFRLDFVSGLPEDVLMWSGLFCFRFETFHVFDVVCSFLWTPCRLWFGLDFVSGILRMFWFGVYCILLLGAGWRR
jgi:hypothetical protein